MTYVIAAIGLLFLVGGITGKVPPQGLFKIHPQVYRAMYIMNGLIFMILGFFLIIGRHKI